MTMTAVETSEAKPDEAAEVILFEGRQAVLPNATALLITILTVGLGAIFFWIRSLSRHYRITSQRIVVEMGVLSKRMEQVDLYRVTDFVVELPLGQRMVGTGNIIIQAMDKTTTEVRLMYLRTDVRDLYERLRNATEVAKRGRNVRIVDNE